MVNKIYYLRFWYALKEHVVKLGTADEILQGVFSEWYPIYSIESALYGEDKHMYQLSVNFKEMILEIVMIDDDGESIISGTKEILDDRFWTIDWEDDIEIASQV